MQRKQLHNGQNLIKIVQGKLCILHLQFFFRAENQMIHNLRANFGLLLGLLDLVSVS